LWSTLHSLLGKEKEEEVEATIEYDCFDNMMDAKYAKVDPIEIEKVETNLSVQDSAVY
jgi:hypothetical protein